jgi:predicted P-loop ATPase
MSVPKDRMTVIVGGKDDGPRKRGGGGEGGRGAEDWRTSLVYSRDGDVRATAHNLALILENDAVMAGLFAFDEFGNRIVLRRSTPWADATRTEFAEEDAFELAAWLAHPERYRLHAKSSVVAEAIEAIARRHRFHPVREYLDRLKWDGASRVPTLLSAYCGAEATDYTTRASEILLFSAVARVLVPGAKADVMIVLEGAQGAGKTRAVRTLFGTDWSAEAMESPSSKDFYQCLAGRWGIEIGEMESFTKAEVNKVKQALSAQDDTYRPSYGRYARKFPRQCVFVGTTNDDQYLRDATGARRFLPVRVSGVDVKRLAADRDQIWAEAFQRYREGVDWWTLPAGAAQQQDARYLADAWSEPIERWLSGTLNAMRYPDDLDWREPAQGGGIRSVTISQVMSWALVMDVGKHTRQDQMRVAAILRRAGWAKRQCLIGGRRANRWYRPENEQEGDDVPF